MFHINVRGLDSPANHAALDALVQNIGQPALVAVTETWLTKKVRHLLLTGYHCVSRLDRRAGQRLDRGGILLYAKDGFEVNVTHIGDCLVDERSWHIVHCDHGPVLLSLWYRPPNDGEVASIRRFEEEFERFSHDSVGSIAIGDFNVRNREWLRFSNRSSAEGRLLEQVCCSHGWKQHVREPTRGPYLLDLVISSFSSGIRCKVVPGIHDNDHDGVLATLDVSIPVSHPVQREVLDFRHANWGRLSASLSETDWTQGFEGLNTNNTAERLTTLVSNHVRACIRSKTVMDKCFVHTWLTEECKAALGRKHAARGSEDFPARRNECSQTFLNAQREHVRRTREKLKSMPRSSRGWWKLSNSLLTKASTAENIPALQRQDGTWATSPIDKACELASVFKEKSSLPSESPNA